MPVPRPLLALLPSLALVACSAEPPADTLSAADADRQGAPAFRVRSDFDAPLNADEGWAAALNEAASVTADRPFRLRFEVDAEATAQATRFKLQYRRNEGDWIDVEAHDFPYPTREHEIALAEHSPGTQPEGWRVVAGSPDGFTVALIDGDASLTARAENSSLMALYPPPWALQEFKFLAGFRLVDPTSDSAAALGFALVFGYVDNDNHWRAWLEPTGAIRITRVVNGTETLVTARDAAVVAGRWLEIEVQYEDDQLEVNFNDDEFEFVVPVSGEVPATQFGIFVPAGSVVELRDLRIEGEPSTPRASIVATRAWDHGASTTDLLPGADTPFLAGQGVSFDERVSASTQGSAFHSEFEWPLVVRRFAEGPVSNEDGDRFEFRMVAADDTGASAFSTPTALAQLVVPPGHLGGTFVETPGRIGPWQAGNGDLYFIMEPSESDNRFMVVKSTDEGRSWREVDGENRPTTGDLESVDSRLVDGTLHILHQVTEATFYHAFAAADHTATPERWLITDELATTVIAMSQMATLVVRSDGSLVTVHLGDTLGYSIRSPEGVWSDEILVADDTEHALVGPQAVLGRDDAVHMAYLRTDGTVHHRRLLRDGTLTPAVQLDAGAGTSEAEYGAVLPLVYMAETDTVVVVYRLEDGYLMARHIDGDGVPGEAMQVTDLPVITDAVDAQQPAADLVLDGSTLHVLFIDPEMRSIHHTCRDLETTGGWRPSTMQVDDILGSWVRGNVYTRRDGTRVYGYVYDAGSMGGAGLNRYAELVIQEGCSAKNR